MHTGEVDTGQGYTEVVGTGQGDTGGQLDIGLVDIGLADTGQVRS